MKKISANVQDICFHHHNVCASRKKNLCSIYMEKKYLKQDMCMEVKKSETQMTASILKKKEKDPNT